MKNEKINLKTLRKTLYSCSSGARWNRLYDLTHEEVKPGIYDFKKKLPMSFRTFYRGLLEAYSTGKCSHFEAIEMFDMVDDFTKYATKKELKWFKEQFKNKKEITLYRGCITKEVDDDNIGCSWTTDIGVAEFFAYRFKDSIIQQGYTPCVIKTTARKNDIAAVIIDRDEKEMILTEVYNSDVKIVGTEPTEEFEKFKKLKKMKKA